jgi:drug/metabolite transporter (DMT)-like permease
LGVWQKILGYEYPQCKLDNFMQISFIFMIAFGLLLVLFFGREKGKKVDKTEALEEKTAVKINWKEIGIIAALGVCMALVNKINTFLAGVLPAVVVFPCTGCGAILCSTVFAMLIFKEMPSRMQKISILLGIVGIVFIGLGAAFL